MPPTDYDDPLVEEQWCNERRTEVVKYLQREKVDHGEVGEWPAWHVAPYVSVWAIESKLRPGWVGWWAISGDLPTDYILASSVKHHREALRTFGEQWKELSSCMSRGESYPDHSIGSPEDWSELAPLLATRADLLLQFADDDDLWKE